MAHLKKHIALAIMLLMLAGCVPVVDIPPPSEGTPNETPVPTLICGDAVIDDGEECDDGNTRDGDGCSSICKMQVIAPSPIPWSFNLHPEDVYEYNFDSSKPTMDAVFQKIVELGGQMVRFDIPWRDVEPYEDAYEKWDFFYEFVTKAKYFYGLEPIAVLGRHPQWAIDYYKSSNPGDKDYYWLLWDLYCFSAAYELGDHLYSYQLANEANIGVDVSVLRIGDPIDEGDDWRQFSECRTGIQDADLNFETIVNVYANWIGWEDALQNWLTNAGDSIDIIGIDHYPGTWSGGDGSDWYPLDRLFYYMQFYGKKGAIVETGYTTYPRNYQTEEQQKQWINIALPIIKEKVQGRSDIVFANYYELMDSEEWDWLRPQEAYFGIMQKNGSIKKAGFDTLKKQIKGTASGMSAMASSCPSYGDQSDADADEQKNVCDIDDDEDGRLDPNDNCPLVDNQDQKNSDNDRRGDACDEDDDNDGVLDENDNCPVLTNPGQEDNDADGIGDVCDPDDDNDGIADAVDNCPFTANSYGLDNDADGLGDACDDDDDNDGVLDVVDNCPFAPNHDQADSDGDGIGDACENETDGDGIADINDNCPFVANASQIDTDNDGAGNACDLDDDNDGVPDATDAFPLNPSESVDTDNDGIGNNADTDDDGDCYSDSVEQSLGSDPLNPASKPSDNDSDCNPNNLDPDDDNDGMPDSWEQQYQLNPLNPLDAGIDSDGDGDSNLTEFNNGTNPRDHCSSVTPPEINLCYDYYGDVGGQCTGATGTHCVSLDEWSPSILVDTDGRPGGCWQRFMLQSDCSSDAVFCVEFLGDSPGADLGQCGNNGVRCAAINQWTDPILLDMDGRNGWCTEKFSIISQDEYTFFLDFWATDGQDANGQCKNVGMSKAYSKYNSSTATIGLDTDDRSGGCWQRFMLKRGTWSMQAF
jgi:cysteine-rich repeat protein